jgi:SAM-dependent methyltransferase
LRPIARETDSCPKSGNAEVIEALLRLCVKDDSMADPQRMTSFATESLSPDASSDESAASAAPPLTRQARKAAGVYYTPARVVHYIVRQTLGLLIADTVPPKTKQLRVLDPACGAGVFLHETYRYLLEHYRAAYLAEEGNESPRAKSKRLVRRADGDWQLTAAEKRRILLRHIFGLDIDERAVQVARHSLACMALEGDAHHGPSSNREAEIEALVEALADNVRCGDALTDSRALEDARFDAVVTNPPYINIRLLTEARGEQVTRHLRKRYRCAEGAFDTYVLFLERAFELLRPGGACGMIVPNKLATLDYAQTCRRLLLEQTTLHRIDDLSDMQVFSDAGVYPYVVVWRKSPPKTNHHIRVLHAGDAADLTGEQTTLRVRQADLSPDTGLNIHGTMDIESRVPTRPLGTRARLHSGTTGFAAQQTADALVERDDDGNDDARRHFDFIVSGNIDRYAIRLGDVRYMKQRYCRPMLSANTSWLTDNKRQLYRESKIVIAGMTRRLETALDPGGLALGVQVYAATEMKDDPLYLLALLNSKLLSYLFRIRFQAKRLSGGYLAINKSQLSKLPIRTIDFDNRQQRSQHERLVELARQATLTAEVVGSPTSQRHTVPSIGQMESIDRYIDQVVYQLYSLTREEIEAVETELRRDS